MSSRKASSKQISYKDESSSEEDSDLEKVDKKVGKKGRKSQKKQKKEEENESSESEFELEKEKPKVKKGNGKGKGGGGGGKKGKGKEKEIKKNPFDVLPFELFTEILSYLSPKDLLHVARTKKSYRSILLSKQRSEAIWKRSLTSVGLPLLKANDWALPVYANLVFTVHCYECGRYSPKWSDPWLRTRLCKPCRQNNLVKLTSSLCAKLNYHPALQDCIVGSRLTTSNMRRLSRGGVYVLPDEISKLDVRLKEIQFEDDEDDSQSVPERAKSSSARGGSTRGRKRSVSIIQRPTRAVNKEKSYREDSDEEEEVELKIGPRMKAFIKKREEYVGKVASDGMAIARCIDTVASEVHQADRLHIERSKMRTGPYRHFFDPESSLRRKAICDRLDLVDGYEGKNLLLVSAQALAKYLEGGSLTDTEWTRIQPNILRLVNIGQSRKRDKDQEAKLVGSEVSRKISLRKFYDELLEEIDDGQWPPLFIDFLLLPSVQLLWRRHDSQDEREKVTEIEWNAAQDDLGVELEEYHLAVIEHAVRVVVSTTQEHENDDKFDSAVDEILSGNLDDFFGQATSMVFCDGGCETLERMSRSRISWMGSLGSHLVRKKTAAFFGTVPEVIAHQLSTHNSHKPSTYQSPEEKRQSQPQFRFSLPLEVASVVSDLVDLTSSKKASINAQRLDSLDQGRFRWKNARGRSYFSKWQNLINRVYIVARKAARSRPPINLPPPEIEWTPPHNWSNSKSSAGLQDSDDESSESEEESDESEDETKGKKREDEEEEGDEEEEDDQLDSD